MKAVIFNETGGIDVLKLSDIAKPTPKPNEVLIKVEYSGVNYIDTYFRTGLYPVQFPRTTGGEGAGVIEEVGADVPADYGLAVGDRVAAYAVGSNAEYLTANANSVLKLPSSVSTKDGAAILIQGLTAWTLCRDAHDLKKGEYALVQAAAGGTGGLLVQMAKAIGAIVIGTVSSEEKAKLARAHGCDHVIIYTSQNLEEEALKITNGLGCHVVYSGVGKATASVDMALTRRKGSFVTFGNTTGALDPVKPLELSKKNIKLLRPTLSNYIAEREEFVQRTTELLDLVASGQVKITIGGEYSLADVAKAQDDLVNNKSILGKLIIKI